MLTRRQVLQVGTGVLGASALLGWAAQGGAQDATPLLATPGAGESGPFATTYGAADQGTEILIGTENSGTRVTVRQTRSLARLDLPYQNPFVARGQFLVIDMIVTLETLAPTPLSYDAFQLFDAGSQRTYTINEQAQAPLARAQSNLSIYDDLQPGLDYDIVLVFDVPTDVGQLWLTDGARQFAVRLAIAQAESLATPIA
jgi:hypothetical protein